MLAHFFLFCSCITLLIWLPTKTHRGGIDFSSGMNDRHSLREGNKIVDDGSARGFDYTFNENSAKVSRRSLSKKHPLHARASSSGSSIWLSIPMPNKSHFAGFDAPDSKAHWDAACAKAAAGEQVLLQQVLYQINSSRNLFVNDRTFRWTHKFADSFYTEGSGGDIFKGIENVQVKKYTNDSPWDTNWIYQTYGSAVASDASRRAPIVSLGKRNFSLPDYNGHVMGWEALGPSAFLKATSQQSMLRRSVVAVGLIDENWGWLSTYFLNRSATWGMSYGSSSSMTPRDGRFQRADQIKEIQHFLNDPNLLMLAVNTHHNFSNHEKVISLPIGIYEESNTLWSAMNKAMISGVKKDSESLLNMQGSDWAFRPAIRKCISDNMEKGKYAEDIHTEKVPAKHQKNVKKGSHGNKEGKLAYLGKVLKTAATICMPGLGADTYRLWESLALGVMPVLERGMGLDRTLYRLPALLVDDFADVTPFLIRQAYVEALYRSESWEYRRMSKQYWQNLMMNVSVSKSIQPLLDQHPMHAVDQGFTRPLIPFSCNGKTGDTTGCGEGTKRTPVSSCAIDFDLVNERIDIKAKYNWYYKHE